MAGDRETTNQDRQRDWRGSEWAGDAASTPGDTPATGGEAGAHWVKTEYVGDHGEGTEAPEDPATMLEGETSISGGRHAPGEQHWSDPTGRDTPAGAPATPRGTGLPADRTPDDPAG